MIDLDPKRLSCSRVSTTALRAIHLRFSGANAVLVGRSQLSAGRFCPAVIIGCPETSLDTDVPDQKIVRLYRKHCDIEIFFRMIKQPLRSAKEIQYRDFDALIGHTSIVFMRYMFFGLSRPSF